MLRGSCLCGGVAYEISGPIDEIHHCHCSKCRKGHAAAFSTYAGIREADFRFTAGANRVRRFQSSPGTERSFCERCGSSLTFRSDQAEGTLWVSAGTFDDDPGMRPQFHMFVDSKAPWHVITDDLTQFKDYPPQP